MCLMSRGTLLRRCDEEGDGMADGERAGRQNVVERSVDIYLYLYLEWMCRTQICVLSFSCGD
jgi:hypothetical protein